MPGWRDWFPGRIHVCQQLSSLAVQAVTSHPLGSFDGSGEGGDCKNGMHDCIEVATIALLWPDKSATLETALLR